MADDSFSKKFLVSNFNNYKMVDSRPVMEQYNELLRILGQYTQHGLKMDESISVSCIIDKLPSFRKDFKRTLKHGKDDLSLVQLNSHLRIEESLRVHDNDKGKGKEVNGPSVNMTEEVPIRNQSWNVGSVAKLVIPKGIAAMVKRTTQMLVVQERGLRTIPKTKLDVIAWWIDSSATTYVCKDRCWFKTYESEEDGSVLYMGDDYFAPDLVIITMHARLGHVHYKRMLEMSKDDIITAIDENPEKCTTCMLTKIARQPFKSIARKSVILELIHRIIHETTAPYTPQQNGVAERKNRALKKMVNFMLSYSGLSEGFWGEAMLMACYLMIRVPDKGNKTTSYELCIEEDPRTYNEAMKSCDAALWKEAINDEIGSIMENNTWVLSDLPPSCKPLGCK
ncbi:zinc finger, CCHC-type containing protein [Tanacetum coccineum]